MKKIITVVGARPQFIKASAVSKALHESKLFDEKLVHTGQHYDKDMSEIFFWELGIKPPEYNLHISGGGHGRMTGRMIEGLESILIDERPEYLLLYGDTNSTLAGAIAGSKLNIKIIHIEAGLRSGNRAMPEEINRILTDHVSEILFTPTNSATNNLINEGIPKNKIYEVGDVMFDVCQNIKGDSVTRGKLNHDGAYVLVTIHRAENLNSIDRLVVFLNALKKLSDLIKIVWPLHPRAKSVLQNANMMDFVKKHFEIISPVGYKEMMNLESGASLIATDSGGVQKEAYFYRVPCVTLRDETEWTELVESGWNTLAPPRSVDAVYNKLKNAIGSSGAKIDLYGNGTAAKSIVNVLEGISQCQG